MNLMYLSYLRTSKSIQRQIDRRLAQLDQSSHVQGKCCSQNIKSKQSIEVLVERRVSWAHEVILGGSTWQRVTYDQLSLTQFMQGFIKIYWMKMTL